MAEMANAFKEMMKVMEENRRESETRMMDMIAKLSDHVQRGPQNVQQSADSTGMVPADRSMFQLAPSSTVTIKKFDGVSGEDEAEEWLADITGKAVLHSWSDGLRLETARNHLIGAASHWYAANQDDLKTWTDFENKFKKTFVGDLSVGDQWERMKGRVQRRDEDVYNYYHEKYRLCKKLKLSFSDIKTEILSGMRNQDLICALMAKGHLESEELIKDIRTYLKIKAASPGAKVAPVVTPRDSKGNNPRLTVADRGKTTISGGSGEVKCYRCGKDGHISKDCSEDDVICFKCSKKGHISKNCTVSTPKQEASGTQGVMIVTNRQPDPLDKFLKEVKVNGREITAFIDPGSAVCTIRNDVTRDNRWKVKPNTQPLFGFGKNQPVYTKGTLTATVKVDGVEVDELEVLVVDKHVQPHPMIIGRTFTELSHIAYARIGDVLQFGYSNEDPFRNLDLDVLSSKMKIYSSESKQVKPGDVCFINIEHADGQGTLSVSNNDKCVMNFVKGRKLGAISDTDNDDREAVRPCEEITRDLVDIDPTATEKQVEELMNLLGRYRKCFALTLDELGCTHLLTADVRDSGVPVSAKPYVHNARDREKISEVVREWKRCGIVSETTSPYASPVLLVGKKDGDRRLVVDYRALNSQTVQINYPIHGIDEQFEKLSGAKIFTILDLSSGYLQIPLTEEAKQKTAFITQDETGQFERLSFGLRNAPFQFVRLMNLALGPLRKNVVMCYLDDLLIPARDWTEMMIRLKDVLDALLAAGLTLKISKCQFGRTQVEFLGQIIENGSTRPSERKTNAIKLFPTPKSVHQIRQFLGLSGFFRRYVPKYAVRARALTDLLKSGVEFKWGPEQESAFADLKNALISEPVLRLFDENAPIELHTDASSKGLAAMMMQRDENDALHVVYCISKKTTESEAQYHAFKLELFAIVWAVERLRPFLLGRRFRVVTDCDAVVKISAKKSGNAQISRWLTVLSEYDYDMKYRAGTKMGHIDALSRSPVEEAEDTEQMLMSRMDVMTIITEEDYIELIQASDTKLRRKMDILKKEDDERTPAEKQEVVGYVCERGRLYKNVKVRGEERLLYVIPDGVRKSVVVKFHDLMGHFALERTVARILEAYWFSGLRRYVRQHIRSCVECLYSKVPGGRQAGHLNPIEPPRRPFERIHCDLLGPFVRSNSGSTYVAVIICALTKYTRLYPLKNAGVEEVLRACEQFVIEYGLPNRLVTDRGTCFTAAMFEDFVERNGIRHTLNSSRHPRANGQVERVNRTLVPVVMTSMNDESSWDECLKQVERDLNTAVNETTGKTPFEGLFGFLPAFYDGVLRKVADKDPDWTPPAIVQEELRREIERSQQKTKDRFDAKKYRGAKLLVGDVVVMKRNPEGTGESTKLQPKYRGPLTVVEVLPSDTYRVTTLNPERGGRILKTTAHISQLKRYTNADEDVELYQDEGDDENPIEPLEEDVGEEEEAVGLAVGQPPESEKDDAETLPQKRNRKPPKWMDDFECDDGEDTD